jgi:Uma2 family endonuclease
MVAKAPAVNTPVQHIVLEHVSWETYESLLADYVDQSVPHFTYDRGKLEIVSPSTPHEKDNRTLAMAVEVVAETWSVNLVNVGSMTFRRQDLLKGFEPDTSFYIQHEEQIRNRPQIQLPVDPPPDLLIEIEVTSPAIAKLPIYAEVGIPEVWRISGDRVTILTLRSGQYHEDSVSLALPPIDSDVASRFLEQSRDLPRIEWIRAVRAWAQAHVRA